nr:hypothetical protein [Tanacetum cinerariifolium]
MREYEWKCPTYGNVNFSFRTIFYMRKHNTPKPESQVSKLTKSSKADMPKGSYRIPLQKKFTMISYGNTIPLINCYGMLKHKKNSKKNKPARLATSKECLFSTRLIIETIHVDFDELTVVASKQFSSGPGPQLLTPRTISSGLVLNPPSPTPYVPPDKKVWDILFQPMFDEYFNPSPNVASPVPVVAAPEPADSTYNDPYFGVLIPELSSGESSSRDVIPTNVHSVKQPPEHLRKWTKDHPLDNVIRSPSRPVSTRHQLQNKAMFCYFGAFLTFVEPKNYKEALKESC